MTDRIVVLGGAGFIGATLAIAFKQDHASAQVSAVDNLKRPGSELNLARLRSQGVSFMHADLRVHEDLNRIEGMDVLVDCVADPAVLSGYSTAAKQFVHTNLDTTLNALELAREHKPVFMFLSTSRVYPATQLNRLQYTEEATRLTLPAAFDLEGLSERGVSETFPMHGVRTLYGAAKLASELLVVEYADQFNFPGIINRCGVVAGPWQFGKVDQGVVAQWVMHHVFRRPLKYIGYGGTGKQVRDIMHVNDLCQLARIQLGDPWRYCGEILNVGGGRENSVSLLELTQLCEQASGNRLWIDREVEKRQGDVPWFIMDAAKLESISGWRPKVSPRHIVDEVTQWVRGHRESLQVITAT